MIVYKYGSLGPTPDTRGAVLEQIQAGVRYWNALIPHARVLLDVEREIREKRDARIGEPAETYNDLRDRLKAARDELKAQRAESRSRSDTAEQRAAVKRLAEEARVARERLKEAREAYGFDAEMVAASDAAQAEFHLREKEERNGSDAFWGTYNCISQSMEQSIAKLKAGHLWRWSKRQDKFVPNNPREHDEYGEGLIGVQIQSSKTIDTDALLSCVDTRLRLDLEPEADESASRERKKHRRGVLWMRIGGSGPGYRQPIFAKFPVIVHRPLPPGADIRGCKVVRRLIADQERWQVDISWEAAEGSGRSHGSHNRSEKSGDGAVFFNFGWRKKSECERRVAYWRDDDGEEDEILIEPEVVSGIHKTDELRGLRDDLRNDMRERLCAWIREHRDGAPDWFLDAATGISQWRAREKFVSLRDQWRGGRWDGDAEGFDLIDSWERGVWNQDKVKRSRRSVRGENVGGMDGGDLHLWRWEAFQRSKSIGRRNDHYKRLAAEFARRYAVLVVEQWNMAGDTRRRKPPEQEPDVEEAKRASQESAVGVLRECLKQAFWSRGGRVIEVSARKNTQRCFECGSEQPWDAKRSIWHTCSECGQRWDQDANNTKNIERKFGVWKREPHDEDAGRPPKRRAKWEKRGRHKGTARKQGDNQAKTQET